ncbi:TetR/AcrR family transcriptional regulator [Xanthobacter sp. KR7-65]|uniref:TetR/AcrR family transcriptional regulator n=1 Tax=Xanthobacter sp. KR7-65 TaxID=3156612 RepID=UPI0032B54D13
MQGAEDGADPEHGAAGGEGAPHRRRRARPKDKGERRREILAAALAVFAARGFAGSRLEDVARRAGVAKGTLYLYFADKEALFRGLIEDNISPVLEDADGLIALFPGTTRELLDLLMELLAQRILEGPAQALVRLMIAEGPRFPELAAYYHRAVVTRGIALIRLVVERGLSRGEITSDLAARFPQLVIAPAIVAVVWNSMFGATDPLDVRQLLAAHRDLLLRGLGWRET